MVWTVNEPAHMMEVRIRMYWRVGAPLTGFIGGEMGSQCHYHRCHANLAGAAVETARCVEYLYLDEIRDRRNLS